MILTTTSSIEGRSITAYHGVVCSELVMPANTIGELFAQLSDKDWATKNKTKLGETRYAVMSGLEGQARSRGADAVVGIHLDHDLIANNRMMISAFGTAVTLG